MPEPSLCEHPLNLYGLLKVCFPCRHCMAMFLPERRPTVTITTNNPALFLPVLAEALMQKTGQPNADGPDSPLPLSTNRPKRLVRALVALPACNNETCGQIGNRAVTTHHSHQHHLRTDPRRQQPTMKATGRVRFRIVILAAESRADVADLTRFSCRGLAFPAAFSVFLLFLPPFPSFSNARKGRKKIFISRFCAASYGFLPHGKAGRGVCRHGLTFEPPNKPPIGGFKFLVSPSC